MQQRQQEQEQAPEEFGRYRLERLIGRGGAGEVWEALDRVTMRRVALKRLNADRVHDEQYRARFLREAKLAARLSDPHVVPIHQWGEYDGRLYIDMRLVVGTDLEQLLTRHGPLPAHRAVSIVGQVASALTAAHEAGLVHRDVKPSNILVTTGPDGRDFAYLADFGITRSTGADRTGLTTGMIVGTADYMPPEQFRSEAEARSDIYSLGCVLFRCLTGSVPFPQQTLPALVLAHLHEEPPAVSDRAPWIGTRLDDVVRRAMAKEPARRYARAVDLASAARVAIGRLEFPRARRPITATLRHALGRPAPGPAAGAGVTGPGVMHRPTVSYGRRRAVFTGIAIATAAVLLLGVATLALTLGRGSSEARPPATVGAPAAAAPAPVSTALPRQIATLAVPGRPETVAIGKDGRFAYLTTSDPAAPALHVVDTTTNTVVASVPIGGVPRFVAVNPVSGNVYVSYNDEAADRLMLAGFDVTRREIVKTVDTGLPADRKYGQTWLFVLGFAPDGSRIYVPHHNASVIAVIDTATNTQVARIPMPRNPHSVAVSPTAPRAYVAAHASGEVDVIDTGTNSFVGSVPIGGGSSPHDLDVSPDGSRVHVANFDAGTVSVIDTATNRVVATVPVGGKPQSVVFAPDGRRSYVVDNATNTLHTIDAVTNTVTGSVPVAPGASMVAISPDGTRAWVSSRDAGLMTSFLTAA